MFYWLLLVILVIGDQPKKSACKANIKDVKKV
jgi:hypothetical protein